MVKEVTGGGGGSRKEVRAERPGEQKGWSAKAEKGARERRATVKSHSLSVKTGPVNIKIKNK